MFLGGYRQQPYFSNLFSKNPTESDTFKHHSAAILERTLESYFEISYKICDH